MRIRRSIVLAGLGVVLVAPMAAAAPEAPAGVLVINTVAGTGEDGNTGDAGPATQAKLSAPGSIAIDGTGTVYFDQVGAHVYQGRIRKVDPKGVISTVLGAGDQLPTTDGIPAAKSTLGRVWGMAAEKSGNLYVLSESDRNGRLTFELYYAYQADSGPMVRMVAGGGSADLGTAKKGLEASLADAHGVGVSATGDAYIVTSRRVVRLGRNSNDLTLIAGNGETNNDDPVDGKDATQVPLWALYSVAEDHDGNVYLSRPEKLYRVSKKDGKISHVACGGDVKPDDVVDAKQARCGIEELAVSPAGDVYFSISYDRVLMLGSDNKIRRIAGGPKPGFGGDGGKASDAKLSYPYGLGFNAAGDLYIADGKNNRIRKISLQAAPVAKDDTVTTDPGKAVTGEVLANDTGTKLTVTAHTEPSAGTVTIPADGKFSYTPKDGFTGADSFTYTVTDSVGQTATAKVAIGVGTAPVPQASNTPGGLASTGASVVGLSVAAAGLLGLGGGLIVFSARRRRRTARR
jgi:hypothetical protein